MHGIRGLILQQHRPRRLKHTALVQPQPAHPHRIGQQPDAAAKPHRRIRNLDRIDPPHLRQPAKQLVAAVQPDVLVRPGRQFRERRRPIGRYPRVVAIARLRVREKTNVCLPPVAAAYVRL